MNTQVEILFEKCWEKYRKALKTENCDKGSFLSSLYANFDEIPKKSVTLLNPWLQIYEEYIFTFHLMNDFISSYWDNTKSGSKFLVGPFLLSNKVCIDLCAIRNLVITGFVESSKTVLRSVVESLCLLLVMLDDRLSHLNTARVFTKILMRRNSGINTYLKGNSING